MRSLHLNLQGVDLGRRFQDSQRSDLWMGTETRGKDDFPLIRRSNGKLKPKLLNIFGIKLDIPTESLFQGIGFIPYSSQQRRS